MFGGNRGYGGYGNDRYGGGYRRNGGGMGCGCTLVILAIIAAIVVVAYFYIQTLN